jgi:hypothetical protein
MARKKILTGDATGGSLNFTGGPGTITARPAPVRTDEPNFVSPIWQAGQTITIDPGNYTGASVTVTTTVEIDTDFDGDQDSDATVVGNTFDIPGGATALGWRYRITERAENSAGFLTYEGEWQAQVTDPEFSATVQPAMSRLHEGEAVEDVTNYATMVNPSNYASTAAAITGVTVTTTGAASSPSDPLLEGESAGFYVEATDANANVSGPFLATPIVVEYKARIIATPTNEAAVEVNDIVAGAETVSVTISGFDAYNGIYPGILASDITGTAAPFCFGDIDPNVGPRITYTGAAADLVATDVLSVDLGLWTITKGTLSFSYVWENNGTPIGGATSSTYALTAGDIGDNITCVVTASDGTDTTLYETAIVVPGTVASPAFVETHAFASTLVSAAAASVNLGSVTLGAGRHFICIGTELTNNSTTISSVTHNGNAVTLATDGVEAAYGNSGNALQAWIGHIATSGTGDLVVNFAATPTVSTVTRWIVRADNYTAIHQTKNASSGASGTDISDTIDVEANGAVLAFTQCPADRTYTWTGLTERWEGNTASTQDDASGAFDNAMSVQTGRTITASLSSTTSRRALAIVSLSA